MTKWIVTAGLVLGLGVLAATVKLWLPLLLGFAKINSSTIQGLQGLVAMALWLGAAIAFIVRLFAKQPKLSTPDTLAPPTAVNQTGRVVINARDVTISGKVIGGDAFGGDKVGGDKIGTDKNEGDVSEIAATDEGGVQEPDARQTRHTCEAPSDPGAFRPTVYRACEMLQQGGDLVDDPAPDAQSDRVWHVPAYGRSTPHLYGPYTTLPVGRYLVVFWMKMKPDPARPGCGRISCHIVYPKGTLNEETTIKPPSPGRYEGKSLKFNVREEIEDVEFRVFQREPGIELWVDTITIKQL